MNFCLVHSGAGFVGSTQQRRSLKRLCAASARVGAVNHHTSLVDGVVGSICLLEDCPLTNAGVGSSLTVAETVECDAAVMTADGGDSRFASVGAVPSTAIPILVARKLLARQERPSSLVTPLTLVGVGARRFANSVDVPFTPVERLVTDDSLASFHNAKRRCRIGATQPASPEHIAAKPECMDTVGAVVVSSDGSLAVGCSSGGSLLKDEGRLGSAAVYGAGCWAECRSGWTVGVAASGCGEYLIRTLFARQCAQFLMRDAASERPLAERLVECFKSDFLDSLSSLAGHVGGTVDGRHVAAGAIVTLYDVGGRRGEYAWVHNAEHFTVGFHDARTSNAGATVSASRARDSVVAQGGGFRL